MEFGKTYTYAPELIDGTYNFPHITHSVENSNINVDIVTNNNPLRTEITVGWGKTKVSLIDKTHLISGDANNVYSANRYEYTLENKRTIIINYDIDNSKCKERDKSPYISEFQAATGNVYNGKPISLSLQKVHELRVFDADDKNSIFADRHGETQSQHTGMIYSYPIAFDLQNAAYITTGLKTYGDGTSTDIVKMYANADNLSYETYPLYSFKVHKDSEILVFTNNYTHKYFNDETNGWERITLNDKDSLKYVYLSKKVSVNAEPNFQLRSLGTVYSKNFKAGETVTMYTPGCPGNVFICFIKPNIVDYVSLDDVEIEKGMIPVYTNSPVATPIHGRINISVGGSLAYTTIEPYKTLNGNVMVSVRNLAHAIGATCLVDNEITVNKGNITAIFVPNSATVKVNNESKTLIDTTEVVAGQLMVPVENFATIFEYTYSYDADIVVLDENINVNKVVIAGGAI